MPANSGIVICNNTLYRGLLSLIGMVPSQAMETMVDPGLRRAGVRSAPGTSRALPFGPEASVSASTISDLRVTGLAIIGGGPAGLAPLLAAHRHGRLDELLDRGLVIVEQGDTLGQGDLGRYAINSDSTGRTFADCLEGPHDTALTSLKSHPLAIEIASAGDAAVPLALVGRFMRLVGETVGAMVAAHPNCAVLTRHRVSSVQRAAAGWIVTVRDRDGQPGRAIAVRDVVSATGAAQPVSRLADETVAGLRLATVGRDRLLQSGDVLTEAGLHAVAARLAGRPDPRVAIVGGSTSAVATAHALLHRLPSVAFAPGALTLLHRRPLRVTYASAEAARAEGDLDFSDDDICPVSGRVFRLGGFRLDSRDLVMQARGIGGRPTEKRLALHLLGSDDAEARRVLSRADLVIAAFGYRPRAIPVFGTDGSPIALHSANNPTAPLVDGRCRILDRGGRPVPNLFGIGLAAGFVPHGRLGGEASFVGQANGLWLWQNDVGLLIVDAVLDATEPSTARPTPDRPTQARPQPARAQLAA